MAGHAILGTDPNVATIVGNLPIAIPLSEIEIPDNITLVGNTFNFANNDDFIIEATIDVQAYDLGRGVFFDIFDMTAGVVVTTNGIKQSFFKQIPAQATNVVCIFAIQSTVGHAYQIRATASGSSNQPNLATVNMTRISINVGGGGGAAPVTTATAPLFVAGTNMTLGMPGVNAVAPVTPDAAASVIWSPIDNAHKALVLQGQAGQAANVLEVQSSAGAVLTEIDSNGNILIAAANRLDTIAAGVLNLGTVNATAAGIGNPAGGASAFQVFINQGGAALHGSNAGLQFSSTTANRAGSRYNQYGANTGVPGITGFKSRGATVGSLASVADGDTLWRATAIGVAGDNATIPLAGFVSIQVPTGGTNPTWVATDFALQLVPLAGPINSRREVFKITSEAAADFINGTTAPVTVAGHGAIRYNNATPAFEVSLNTGAWTPLVTSVSATAPLFASATHNFTLGAAGSNAVAPTTADANASVIWSPFNAAHKGLVIQGQAAQAANLQEWQSSVGTVLAFMDPAGNMTITGKLTVGGAIDPTSLSLAGTAANTFLNMTNGNTVGVSAANTGTIRYNSTSQTFQMSLNGAAFADIAAGGATPFSSITSGTNTTATMIVGAGASMKVASGGVFGLSTAGTGTNNYFFGDATTGAAITTGSENIGIGTGALHSATSAFQNVVIGHQAGLNLIDDTQDVIIGWNAGQGALTGNTGSVFIGFQAGQISIANNNTFMGWNAGNVVTSGSDNTVSGTGVAASLTTGSFNTVMGSSAGSGMDTGANNVLIGASATVTPSSAGSCVAIGAFAVAPESGGVVVGFGSGRNGATSTHLTAIGNQTGSALTTGNNDTFLGYRSGNAVTTGSDNTFVGNQSGLTLTTGSQNIVLGSQADVPTVATSNVLIAGSGAAPVNDVYFGKGFSNAAPTAYTIHGVGGLGAAVAGADLILAGGISGDAATAGGRVLIQTAPAGAGQTLANVVYVLANGNVGIGASPGAFTLDVNGAAHINGKLTVVGGIDPTFLELAGTTANTYLNMTDGQLVGLAPANQGRIRYNNVTHVFEASMNGAAFATISTGGGGTAFNAITSGTNTTAAMVVGNGASLKVAPAGVFGISTIGATNTVVGDTNTGNALAAGANDNTLLGAAAGGALTTGTANTIIGSSAMFTALTTGIDNTVVGFNAGRAATGNNSCIFGANAGSVVLTTGVGNILIGLSADVNAGANGNGISIGVSTKTTTNATIISTNAAQSSTANDLIIESTDTSIRRAAAAIVKITDGTAGGAGAMQFNGGATGTFAVSPASTGRIFYDSTLQHFFISENGGAYAQISTGGGGGSAFNAITSGTNTTATMTVGTGATLGQSGSGIIGLTSQGTAARTYVMAASVSSITSAADCVLIGDNAGNGLTSGNQNTFVGSSAGKAVTTVADVTAIGFKAGFVNTAAQNTFLGSQAGVANVAGVRNVFVGYQAGNANSAATDNDSTFVGYQAGLATTTTATGGNTFVGSGAGKHQTGGALNTCIGFNAGPNPAVPASASGIIAIGANAITSSSGRCIVIGTSSGSTVMTGQTCIVLGSATGTALTSCDYSVLIGSSMGISLTSAVENVVIGCSSWNSLTSGNNVLIGSANDPLTSGADNVMIGNRIGTDAGTNNSIVLIGRSCFAGNNSVSIGFQAGYSNTIGSSSLRSVVVGRLAAGGAAGGIFGGFSGNDNTLIGDTAATQIQAGARNVIIGSGAGTGVSGGLALQSGSNNILIGYNAAVNAIATASAIVIGEASRGAASCVIIGVAKTSATTNDFIIESGDVGLRRAAANIMSITNGAGGSGAQEFIGAATATFAVSPASNGRLFFDSTLNHFSFSENGAAYNSIAPRYLVVNAVAAAGYTLVLADDYKLITLNTAGANTLNIPTDATVAFPVGTQITVAQIGAGQWTIAATTPGTTTVISTGATSAQPALRVQNSSATLIKTAANSWLVVGDIV